MIHSVRVKDGEVRYSNQWINTPKFEIEKKFDRNVFLQLGEFFGFVGLLKILFLGPMLLSVFKLKPVEVGAANTAMLLYNNRLYACYESSLLFEIKWHANNSFSSIGYDSFEGAMDFPVTAHSKVDPVDGGMYINSYMPSTDSSGNNMKVAVVKGRTVEANYGFKLPTVSWAHDMSMTENYILILDSSVHFDRNGIMTGAFFDMDNNHKFRVGAAPKTAHSADEIVWFTADQPYAIVHTLNAWEEVTVEGDREIVLWASLSDSWQGHSLNSTEHFDQSELRMSFATGRMQVNKLNALSNGGVEFPRVHPQYIGRRTKYGYAGGFPMVGDARVSQILKINTDSQEVEATISFPEGKYSSEPVPFPKGEETGVGSDEVFISVFIFDENTQTSEWHLYDGQSMDTSPVVAYSVPRRVPYGFHGLWLTEKELQDHMIA